MFKLMEDSVPRPSAWTLLLESTGDFRLPALPDLSNFGNVHRVVFEAEASGGG